MKKENGVLTRRVTRSQHAAIRALSNGTANEMQQKLALNYILDNASEVGGLSFVEDDDSGRKTTFKEGRRHVGIEILGLIKTVKLRDEEYQPEPNQQTRV